MGTTTTRYYKYLNKDGSTPHGYGKWDIPKDDKKPGKWLSKIKGDLVACRNGYHVMEIKDILHWEGKVLVEVEVRGDKLQDGNKTIVQQARVLRIVEEWNEKNQHLFAADCASHVLSLFEIRYPDDYRPRKAIEAAQKYANGQISREELDAAWDAAWAARDAAWDAAGDAAGDAAWAAWAARAAARAVRAAEQKFQIDRLIYYIEGNI